LWIIAIEIIIIISVIVSLRLYKLLIKPLEFTIIGTESLKNKDYSNKFVMTGNYEIDLLIEVYNRMLDQLREERIISEEKNYFLDKLIESSPVGIITLDFDEKISSLNPSAYDLLKMQPDTLIGKTSGDANNDLLVLLNQCELDKNLTFSINGVKKYKCYKSHFINKGFKRHFIIFEELTNEIIEAEKYAYARVIRMMSHEINNTVGSINSLLESISIYKKALPHNKQTEYEDAIKIAIERNLNLGIFISNFADVIRLPKPKLKEYDINMLLKKVIHLMKTTKPEMPLNISTAGIEDKFTLKIDPVQFEQALINILKNSIESISGKGMIQIIMSKKERKLTIRDNGQGITKENSTKLFTPFFSTKPHGQGIGLTMVREILINHFFRFALSTKPDGFTDFEIWFDL
jgi:two-component system nitrogen regulation sensor histidine kinase NtrY